MDTLVLYLYALATCCDSVLVSTRFVVTRSCAGTRLMSLGLPFICGVNPGSCGAHGLLRPGVCYLGTRRAYGRVTRKFR